MNTAHLVTTVNVMGDNMDRQKFHDQLDKVITSIETQLEVLEMEEVLIAAAVPLAKLNGTDITTLPEEDLKKVIKSFFLVGVLMTMITEKADA